MAVIATPGSSPGEAIQGPQSAPCSLDCFVVALLAMTFHPKPLR